MKKNYPPPQKKKGGGRQYSLGLRTVRIKISVLQGEFSFSKCSVTFLNLSEPHSFQYSTILPTCTVAGAFW